MSVIKQISVFNGSDWNTGDIGADASNIDISSAILGSSTNVQSALTTIGNKIGTTAIPSALGTTITGAINTLNTNLNNPINTSFLYTMNLPVAITDFNNFQNRSIVWANNTQNNFTNAPGQGAYFTITVFPISGYGFQLAIHYNSSTGSPAYVRTMTGNIWNSWKSITLN